MYVLVDAGRALTPPSVSGLDVFRPNVDAEVPPSVSELFPSCGVAPSVNGLETPNAGVPRPKPKPAGAADAVPRLGVAPGVDSERDVFGSERPAEVVAGEAEVRSVGTAGLGKAPPNPSGVAAVLAAEVPSFSPPPRGSDVAVADTVAGVAAVDTPNLRPPPNVNGAAVVAAGLPRAPRPRPGVLAAVNPNGLARAGA